MTEHVNTGGNAFPSKVTIPDGQFDPFSGKKAQGNQEYIQMGMTMRDYFAGKALPAILAQKDVHRSSELKNAAWIAYQMADEMLIAREK